MAEDYTWVDRQVGKRGRWLRLRLAELPYPPDVDDKVTMQRFASPFPHEGEPHKSSFVLDFDAHADWLTLEVCRQEVVRFLSAWEARWGVSARELSIAFSGRAGFHVTIPALLLGDSASPNLTAAYRRWACQIKDTLGLITLDAPSRQTPEWWYPHIQAAVGVVPAAVLDRDAFALSLRRVGIYTRRRMVRRENSLHPRSGRFKIPLLPEELGYRTAHILTLAEHPRTFPPRLAPPTHPDLAAYLKCLLAHVTAQEQRGRARNHTSHDRDRLPAMPLPVDVGAPLCIQRILTRPAPEGSSNMPLILLLSYWRATGIPEDTAIHQATAWLLYGVTDAARREERYDSARSVGHAVYAHDYRFAYRFVEPLHLVSPTECAVCPLRGLCWRDCL